MPCMSHVWPCAKKYFPKSFRSAAATQFPISITGGPSQPALAVVTALPRDLVGVPGVSMSSLLCLPPTAAPLPLQLLQFVAFLRHLVGVPPCKHFCTTPPAEIQLKLCLPSPFTCPTLAATVQCLSQGSRRGT